MEPHHRSRETLPFLCEDCHDKLRDDPLCPDCLDKVEARNELAMQNSGLVGYTIKRYFRRNPLACQHYPHDDAYADGFLGLLRAAELYKPKSGYSFTTYASYWVMQSLTRGWDKHFHLIHKPAHLDTIPVEAASGYDLKFFSQIAVQSKDVVNHDVREIQRIVREEITKLHHRESYVLLERLRERTLQQIAEELSLTRERVRQLEFRARAKLAVRLKKALPSCLMQSLPYCSPPPPLPTANGRSRK